MKFSKPITEIIQERYSCRSYQTRPITEDQRWATGLNAAQLLPLFDGKPGSELQT